MVGSLPTDVAAAGIFLAVALVAWLLFTIIWYLVERVARMTGVDAKVDQFLDTDGAGPSDEERVKHVGGFKHGSGGGCAALRRGDAPQPTGHEGSFDPGHRGVDRGDRLDHPGERWSGEAMLPWL